MAQEMTEKLRKELESLGKIEIQISAHGTYPGKHGTRVQDVAVYQNDGTKHIKASHFVERAAKQHRYWETIVYKAARRWMRGDRSALDRVGRIVARNINDKVDRIKTRRLKHSFRHIIKRSR